MSRRESGRSDSSNSKVVWWAGILSVLACALLAAPNLMGSAGASGPTTIKAPYKGAVVTPYNDLTELSGCASARGAPIKFVTKTGAGSWSGSSSSKSCTGKLAASVQTSVSIVQDAVEIAIPVPVTVGPSASTNFSVTWNVTAAGNISLAWSGVCPAAVYNPTYGYGYSFCTAEAIDQEIGDAWLVDLTNGSITYPSFYPATAYVYNYTENYSYCFNANCSSGFSGNYSFAYGHAFSGPTTQTYWINATTNSAHRYAIVTYFGGDLVTEMETYHGSASAFMNVATMGNGFKLASVVES